MKNYLKTNVKVFIDDKEVFNEHLKIIEVKDSNSKEMLKRYDSFEGKIKLTKKQFVKLLIEMVKNI